MAPASSILGESVAAGHGRGCLRFRLCSLRNRPVSRWRNDSGNRTIGRYRKSHLLRERAHPGFPLTGCLLLCRRWLRGFKLRREHVDGLCKRTRPVAHIVDRNIAGQLRNHLVSSSITGHLSIGNGRHRDFQLYGIACRYDLQFQSDSCEYQCRRQCSNLVDNHKHCNTSIRSAVDKGHRPGTSAVLNSVSLAHTLQPPADSTSSEPSAALRALAWVHTGLQWREKQNTELSGNRFQDHPHKCDRWFTCKDDPSNSKHPVGTIRCGGIQSPHLVTDICKNPFRAISIKSINSSAVILGCVATGDAR